MVEVGGRMAEVGDQRSEDGGRMPARLAPWMPRSMQKKMARLQRAENGGQSSEVGGQRSEIGGRSPEDGRQSPEVGSQRPQAGTIFGGRIRPRQVAVPFQNYRRYRRS